MRTPRKRVVERCVSEEEVPGVGDIKSAVCPACFDAEIHHDAVQHTQYAIDSRLLRLEDGAVPVRVRSTRTLWRMTA